MIKGKKPNTCEVCEAIAEPVLEKMGLYLWDVKFEKEGSAWFLRYFIDKDGGVTIEDCESFSRAVDPLLDEADPISQSYYLEVSSPGIERELTKDWHYGACMNENIMVRLIRPEGGQREFTGELVRYENGGITIICEDGGEKTFRKNETAFVRLCDNI